MADAQSRAEATWQGSLTEGKGNIKLSSGATGDLPISWTTRTERAQAQGKTSPEELIAGAQAGCYAMALSHVLGLEGKQPEMLDVSTVCTFGPTEGGFKISSMDINVRGKVPGLDQAGFEKVARTAEQGCPVTNAIRNNVEIHLKAQLES